MIIWESQGLRVYLGLFLPGDLTPESGGPQLSHDMYMYAVAPSHVLKRPKSLTPACEWSGITMVITLWCNGCVYLRYNLCTLISQYNYMITCDYPIQLAITESISGMATDIARWYFSSVLVCVCLLHTSVEPQSLRCRLAWLARLHCRALCMYVC